jgi:hypothetical protein
MATELNDKLIDACEVGDIHAAKRCVEQGANIHTWDDSIMQWAVKNGHIDLVK